jgi:hypothetical protein
VADSLGVLVGLIVVVLGGQGEPAQYFPLCLLQVVGALLQRSGGVFRSLRFVTLIVTSGSARMDQPEGTRCFLETPALFPG